MDTLLQVLVVPIVLLVVMAGLIIHHQVSNRRINRRTNRGVICTVLTNGDVHVVPAEDTIIHVNDLSCLCLPIASPLRHPTGSSRRDEYLVMHRAKDGPRL